MIKLIATYQLDSGGRKDIPLKVKLCQLISNLIENLEAGALVEVSDFKIDGAKSLQNKVANRTKIS